MGTGACGIDCTVCGLHIRGDCTSCGPGTSDEGRAKMEAQKELFGMACTMLECAISRGIAYCTRDCPDFPCTNFTKGPYPYSEGYLSMQRRRREHKHAHAHMAPGPEAAGPLWDELAAADPADVCRRAAVTPSDHGGFLVKSLHETWVVNPVERITHKAHGDPGGEWDRIAPFLMLVYLLRTEGAEPSGEMIAPRDVLPGRDFFGGLHRLKTRKMSERFEDDAGGFAKTGHALGGEPTENGDASFRLYPFPRLPVEYILWLADDEFPAQVKILLDRDTMKLYPLDACEKAVNLLNERILLVAKEFL